MCVCSSVSLLCVRACCERYANDMCYPVRLISLFLPFSLRPIPPPLHIRTRALTHSPTHTHTLTHTNAHTRTQTPTLTHTHSHSNTCPYTHSDYCCGDKEHTEAFKEYVAQRGYHLLSVSQYGKTIEAAGFEDVKVGVVCVCVCVFQSVCGGLGGRVCVCVCVCVLSTRRRLRSTLHRGGTASSLSRSKGRPLRLPALRT